MCPVLHLTQCWAYYVHLHKLSIGECQSVVKLGELNDEGSINIVNRRYRKLQQTCRFFISVASVVKASLQNKSSLCNCCFD